MSNDENPSIHQRHKVVIKMTEMHTFIPAITKSTLSVSILSVCLLLLRAVEYFFSTLLILHILHSHRLNNTELVLPLKTDEILFIVSFKQFAHLHTVFVIIVVLVFVFVLGGNSKEDLLARRLNTWWCMDSMFT